MTRRPVLAAALLAPLALGLSACNGEKKAESTPSETIPPLTSTAITSVDTAPVAAPGSECYGLNIDDAWIKATTPEKKMTGAFATITNTGTKDAHIVKGASEGVPKIEMHETTVKDGKPVMQEKQGGFVIKPGATLTLAPGKDHVMLMGLDGELTAGSTITVMLECQDGSKTPLTGEVRTYSGGNETYHGGEASTGGHSTGSHSMAATTTPAATTK